MDVEYFNNLTATGTCYLYASTFDPDTQVNSTDANATDGEWWIYCDRQGVSTTAPTTPRPTDVDETFAPTTSPTVWATDFGAQANALCTAGYQVGRPPDSQPIFGDHMTARECAREAAANGATAWAMDNEFLVRAMVFGARHRQSPSLSHAPCTSFASGFGPACPYDLCF